MLGAVKYVCGDINSHFVDVPVSHGKVFKVRAWNTSVGVEGSSVDNLIFAVSENVSKTQSSTAEGGNESVHALQLQ